MLSLYVSAEKGKGLVLFLFSITHIMGFHFAAKMQTQPLASKTPHRADAPPYA